MLVEAGTGQALRLPASRSPRSAPVAELPTPSAPWSALGAGLGAPLPPRPHRSRSSSRRSAGAGVVMMRRTRTPDVALVWAPVALPGRLAARCSGSPGRYSAQVLRHRQRRVPHGRARRARCSWPRAGFISYGAQLDLAARSSSSPCRRSPSSRWSPRFVGRKWLRRPVGPGPVHQARRRRRPRWRRRRPRRRIHASATPAWRSSPRA